MAKCCKHTHGWTNFKMSSPWQNKAKRSYKCISSNTFQGAAHQYVGLSPLVYLLGHLKAQAYSAAIEILETLHQRNLYACEIILNYPGPMKGCSSSLSYMFMCALFQGGGYFEHLFWTGLDKQYKLMSF
jgi:hypothetical protein